MVSIERRDHGVRICHGDQYVKLGPKQLRHMLRQLIMSDCVVCDQELKPVTNGGNVRIEVMNRPAEEHQILTGYRIGGKTWISEKWNRGELRLSDIESAIEEERRDCQNRMDDDALEEYLRRDRQELALEIYEGQDEDDPQTFEDLLQELVDEEYSTIRSEEESEDEVLQALIDLRDFWVGSINELAERVYAAHTALDDHCRALCYGEFHPI